MIEIQNINIDNFDYDLPDHRIAKYPLTNRDLSKLLIYKEKKIDETFFSNINELLPAKSLLVFNNTKVIQARLEFFKETGSRIEIFCLEPFSTSDYNLAFSQNKSCKWHCIVGNLKKWKEGVLQKKVLINGANATIEVKKLERVGDSQIIEFSWNNEQITFSEILESEGNIPIPPYLNRPAEENDLVSYQTIYSKYKGSVAAPTAGLHFTPQVFESLKENAINFHEITLHVGAGTFKPVKTTTIGQHEMHAEYFVLNKTTIPVLLNQLGNITAVGTTTVRTLESLYWLGVKILLGRIETMEQMKVEQWDAYTLPQHFTVEDSLNALHQFVIETGKDFIMVSTAIMIAPGYRFQLINRLITNFHQPKSTLLLLIAAFIGSDWIKIYEYALSNQFRFLSYGDSCFLAP